MALFPQMGVSPKILFLVVLIISRQPCPADAAGMAAEFRNHGISAGDRYVVNARTSVARDFAGLGDQPVAELARADEGDVALRRDDPFVISVAGKGECRIRQRENEAA